MRAMWRVHGKPGGAREGYVDRPYTIDDAEARLAEVSGDAAFARDSSRATFRAARWPTTRACCRAPGWCCASATPAGPGGATFRSTPDPTAPGSGRCVPANAPAYAAGIDQDDTLLQIAGERVTSAETVSAVLGRHRPGDRVTIAYLDRTGESKTATVVLAENPHVDVVPIESTGGSLTAAQRAFRDRWLKSQQ